MDVRYRIEEDIIVPSWSHDLQLYFTYEIVST